MKIPIEIKNSFNHWIKRRDFASLMIKNYTDDWITASQKLIQLSKVIEKLKE
jgi:hypothetical protein